MPTYLIYFSNVQYFSIVDVWDHLPFFIISELDIPLAFFLDVDAAHIECALNTVVSIHAFSIDRSNHRVIVLGATGLYGFVDVINNFIRLK